MLSPGASLLEPSPSQADNRSRVLARPGASAGHCGRSPSRFTVAEKIAGCRKRKVIVRCPNCGDLADRGPVLRWVPVPCHNRLCPDCARARSMLWLHKLLPVARQFRFPLMLTLTTVAGPDLAGNLALIVKAFRQLRRAYTYTRDGKKCGWVRGFYAVEVKRSSLGWYVHLHALIDSGVWVDPDLLAARWQKLTGAYIVKLERVKKKLPGAVEGAVREVVKYVTKGVEVDGLSPAEVEVLGEAIRGHRLVACWGLREWFDAASSLDTKETSLHGLVCPFCGSALRCLKIVPVQAFPEVKPYDFTVRDRAGPSPGVPVADATHN